MAIIYATLAQIKAAISDNSESGVGYPTKGDTNLTQLENAAANMIDRYCGRSRPRTFVASSDTTRTFHALGSVVGTVLHLSSDLAQTPTTVTHNNGGTTVVVTTNYMLLSDHEPNVAPYSKIQLIDGTEWAYTSNPVNAISVTGRFAYSVTPPENIIRACIHLTVALWRQRHTTANVQSATLSADGTIIYPDGFPKVVVDLLEPYIV